MIKIELEHNNETSLFLYIPNILDNVSNVLEFTKTIQFAAGTSFTGSRIHRKQIWFQEEGKYFCKQWNDRYARWEGHKYVENLNNIQINIKNIVSNINCSPELDINFNSCLINYYENGEEFITPHQDSILSFGAYPTIVNLSIGSTRLMRIRNLQKEIVQDIHLENNSLFIMAGASQKYYTHEIVKDPSVSSPRYSFTFRKHIN